MRILITGKGGKAGSWKIRGEQLGAAIGATVIPKCDAFHHSDLIVLVKRIPAEILGMLQRSNRPWVWDIVDAWPQKDVEPFQPPQAVQWLQNTIREVRPSAIVFPTTKMKDDSGWSGPSLVLPHHAWQRYSPKPLNRSVYVLGYEGSHKYLGHWHSWIAQECARRGWVFSVNDDMSQADIGVAVRAPYNYAAFNWKSNVKLANIQALGIPAICTEEEGYKEFGSGTECFVDSQESLSKALDSLTDQKVREEIRQRSLQAAPRLEDVAERYRKWLLTLNF